MERLTDNIGLKACDSCKKCEHLCNAAEKAIEKLKDYEDAEENGLIVRLPCKIGDTVFKVFENFRWDEDGTEDWFEYEILEKPFEYKDIDAIGKTVFLTQAEAEAKLKEMEGENGD